MNCQAPGALLAGGLPTDSDGGRMVVPSWHSSVDYVVTTSQLLLHEAIDQVRQASDGETVSREDRAQAVIALVISSLSLELIIDAAEGLLHSADHPGRPAQARPIPVEDVQAVLERVLALQEGQLFDDDDDRSDEQKMIENAIDPDTVLAEDKASSSALQELGILELLQCYPCHGVDARWTADAAISFLELKAHWLDQALDQLESSADDESDWIEAKVVVLVVPEQVDQSLHVEVRTVQIPIDF
jgi:hypothetical protein